MAELKTYYLEFYENKKREFESLAFTDQLFDHDPTIKRRLEQTKGFISLRRLCDRDEKLMFVVLQTFVLLPSIKEIEALIKVRQGSSKDIPASVKEYQEKLIDEGIKNFDLAKFIDPEINRQKFKMKLIKWVDHKVDMKKCGWTRWDDAIEFVCMVDSDLKRNRLLQQLEERLSETFYVEIANNAYKKLGAEKKYDPERQIGFNEILHVVFESCMAKTGLKDTIIRTSMVEVLNSLGITTKDGKSFTEDNLRKLFNRV